MAEDDETKFRSEAAKLRVGGWLAGRVEQRSNQREVGETESHAPSGAASTSAPAVASSSSGSGGCREQLSARRLHQVVQQQLINTKVMQFQIMVSRE